MKAPHIAAETEMQGKNTYWKLEFCGVPMNRHTSNTTWSSIAAKNHLHSLLSLDPWVNRQQKIPFQEKKNLSRDTGTCKAGVGGVQTVHADSGPHT